MTEEEKVKKCVELTERVAKGDDEAQEQACYIMLSDEQRNKEIEEGSVWQGSNGRVLGHKFRARKYDNELRTWYMTGVDIKTSMHVSPNVLKHNWELTEDEIER